MKVGITIVFEGDPVALVKFMNDNNNLESGMKLGNILSGNNMIHPELDGTGQAITVSKVADGVIAYAKFGVIED